jgi:SAM-dependent methyltransferase
VSGPPDFDAYYRADPDPWDVGGSFFEQRKRAVVLASLRRARYAGAWDPACGTGHLTADVAARCDRVLASDASPTAALLAAARCAELPVEVSHRALPEPPVDGGFAPGLVVLSEVFYYLSDQVRAATVAVVDQRAAPDAEVVAVHWDGAPSDAWLSGRGGQTELVTQLVARGWTRRVHHEDDGFLLDVVTRGSA